MRKGHVRRVLLFCLLIMLPRVSRLHAMTPEGGPEYFTDSHGASGAAHALLELGELDAKYTKYGRGALDWLLSVAAQDDEGDLTWYFSASAPAGHRNRIFNPPYLCHTLQTFMLGYEKTGDQRYRDAALAGTRWLVKVGMVKVEDPDLGVLCGFSHQYSPRQKNWDKDKLLRRGLGAGHSHGLGNFLDTLLLAYKLSGEKSFREAIQGIMATLKLKAHVFERDGEKMLAWEARKNPGEYETGYCYGQAGIAAPLLNIAETLPDLTLRDGTTALAMANANLRYLMSVAEKSTRTPQGRVWPYMRHARESLNPGYGSGTGGIGWVFLRGAKVNRERDPAFAERCMAHAREAALFALEVLETIPEKKLFTIPGGDFGFGVCGGMSGAGHFLELYAGEIRRKDPAFVERIQAAAARIASGLLDRAVELDGTLVWPDRFNFKGNINMALDFGQTGVVLALAGYAGYLDDAAIKEAAMKAGDFIVKQAVPEGGGYKFPRLVPYTPLHGGRP